MPLSIYQTIEQRSDQSDGEIVEQGPILCQDALAWLGKGYYFWDTSLENAHWWGRVHYQNNYVVCGAEMDLDTDTCFDFMGCVAHGAWFIEQMQVIKSRLGSPALVPIVQVLELLFRMPGFTFAAVRANGLPIENRPPIEAAFPYERYGVDLYNRTQICIRDLSLVNFRNFRVQERVS